LSATPPSVSLESLTLNDEADAMPSERISHVIVVLRDRRVILDRDLAALYGVTTARLNEAVKRNARRFPLDFMFRVTDDDHIALMSQIATSKKGRGGHRKTPFAFTEHGAIQAANVLNSERAIEMGVHVVRAFVRLRELLVSNKDLSHELAELERKYKHHDKAITAMLSAIRQLMNPPPKGRRGIRFTADPDQKETGRMNSSISARKSRKSPK
jgi:hypothetical protein